MARKSSLLADDRGCVNIASPIKDEINYQEDLQSPIIFIQATMPKISNKLVLISDKLHKWLIYLTYIGWLLH
jgi:hypothetical protein